MVSKNTIIKKILYTHILGVIIILSLYSFNTPNIKIGLLLADLSIERWAIDKKYIEASAKAQGYDIIISNADNNQEKQIEQAKEMIKAGVKVLIIVPVDAYKAAQIVDLAHEAGIMVIAYDRLIMNSDADVYISYDNEMVGKIMAIYITMRKPKGNFAYIGGPKSDRNSFLIRKGIMDYLKPLIDKRSVEMVCDTFTKEWNEHEAFEITQKYLGSGKKIPDAIFAGNDKLALGIIKALELKGLAGKVLVTGQDADLTACRNIINGKQTLTIFKPIRTLADRSIMLSSWLMGDIVFEMNDNIDNGKIMVPYFKLFPVPVDSGNMINTVIQEQFHSKEEIYMNQLIDKGR